MTGSIMAGSSFSPWQSSMDAWAGGPSVGNGLDLNFGQQGAPADGFKFGMNMPTAAFGLHGLNSLGNLWGAWQSNKLAKDQLNFTKNFAQANLSNQTQAYNTALEDRSRARAAVEGQNSQQQQDYVNRNRLPDRGF